MTTQSYAEEIIISAPQADLKAMYLVHISKLTTWPKGKKIGTDFSICIDKSSKVSAKLAETGKDLSVKGKKLRLEHNLTVQNLIKCDVFYVSSSNYFLFKQFRSQLEEHAVLTVSSEDDFTSDEGGVIGYYIVGRVKMSVNLQAMRQSDLRISSRLLRLMKTVP